MKARLLLTAVLGIALLVPGAARPGETLSCFNANNLGSCDDRALAHVGFKSVVLQYVDPAGTGLGEGLSRLLWREILESISDLSDAGVILAYDREGDIEEALGEENLQSFLQRTYHEAAQAIAEQQDAQMSIWGAILPDGDRYYVQTFVTLRETEDDRWTRLHFAMKAPVEARLSASLGRSRLNLPAVSRDRQALVGGRYVTRCNLDAGCPDGVALRADPSNDAPVEDYVPVGGTVEVADMQQQWLKLAGAPARWINIYHVEMFPRTVTFFSRLNVNLRREPGGEAMATVNLDGDYQVRDAARYGGFGEPWYRLAVGAHEGWIAGRLVNRRSYRFPGVHLIAGLYRYGRGQFRVAAGEFEAFLASVPEEDNVTRAATLKFLAASRLAAQEGPPQVARALDDLDAAMHYTPFDPDAHTLRALVKLGSADRVGDAVTDIRQALELDSRHPGALQLLQQIDTAAGPRGLEALSPDAVDGSVQVEFRTLKLEYLRDQR